MKNILVLSALVAILQVNAQSYNGPESVEWDAANNRWLIGNTGSHAILARTPSGVLSTFVASTTSGPYGLEILGNVLYACSGGSIKGYDLTTGSQVFNLNLGASFLNGLTTDGDSVLYTTDFSNKDIFRVNPATNQFYAISTNTVSTPNGIIYDGPNNRCIFVSWGGSAPIKAIGLNPPYTISTLATTTLGNCDGITRDQLGYWYVTAWSNNRLNRFASDFTGGFTAMNSFVLNSPADIDCKIGTIDTVGVPNSGNNTCTFIPLAPPVASFTYDSIVCLNEQSTFTNTSSNADSFSWLFNGGSPGSGTTSPLNITYDTLGAYTAVLTTTNIYGTTTATHTVLVQAGPAPGITAVGNDLSTTGTFQAYQWYQDGVLIPGATSQTYTMTEGGEYYCVVTENGCSGTSNIITSSLGIDNNIAASMQLYPNPASEILTIELRLPLAQSIHYSIMDMQGRVLVSATEQFQFAGLNYLLVNVADMANGTYVLQLNGTDVAVNRSFVVNK
jgi:hypothetical protein